MNDFLPFIIFGVVLGTCCFIQFLRSLLTAAGEILQESAQLQQQQHQSSTAVTTTSSEEVLSPTDKRLRIQYNLVSRRYNDEMADPSKNDSSCSICLSDFVQGEEVSQSVHSECAHLFHTNCITDWLLEHQECPVCRRDFMALTPIAQP